jgi:hypothetical protein
VIYATFSVEVFNKRVVRCWDGFGAYTQEGEALLMWMRYGAFLDGVDDGVLFQRQEKKDRRCLQHVRRASHPVNFTLTWSVRSRATF